MSQSKLKEVLIYCNNLIYKLLQNTNLEFEVNNDEIKCRLFIKFRIF